MPHIKPKKRGPGRFLGGLILMSAATAACCCLPSVLAGRITYRRSQKYRKGV